MYKRKCSESLTKSNSHQTVHVPDPPVRRSSSGSSLSPLLAAIYLIPLDKAFSQHPDFFYRRYMDDWVIICHSRRALRQETFTGEFGVRKISVIFQVFYKNKFNSTAIERIFRKKLGNSSYFCSSNLACKGLSTSLKKVYSIMKSLNVEIHPDKTWLGRVKNGFDFLGFRISPTTIQPSTASVSRRDEKVAWLYEQGASKKRIGQYLRRWLGWSLLAATSTVASAAPGDPAVDAGPTTCNFTIIGFDAAKNFPITSPISNTLLDFNVVNGPALPSRYSELSGIYEFITYSVTPPTLGFPLPSTAADTNNEPAVAIFSSTTVFMTGGADLNNNTCTYSYTLTSDDMGQLSRSDFAYYQLLPPAPSDPTAVPLFTPIGLIATISGLLWFGRRRKAIKLTQT